MTNMEPLITIVATAHNEDTPNRVFVHSMLNQIDKSYKAVVMHNGHNASMELWVNDQNDGAWNEEGTGYVKFKSSKVDTGNWGTANRQQAINECDTEYIIQTSVQDYWLPQATQIINNILKEKKPDILLWNSINHLVGPCQVLDSQLAWSKIDWGNFAIRTEIAKKVGIQHGDKYTADWLFIQDVLNSGLVGKDKIIKCTAVLTIHN